LIEEITGQSKFIIRRDVFAIGGAFRVLNTENKLLLYSRQKIFKLKEDIRVYNDLEMHDEVLFLNARQILDFSGAFDVIDSKTNEKIGALRRKGIRSMIRDKWEVLDENDNLFAYIEEDSMGMALLRRFLTNLIPQKFTISDINTNNTLVKINQAFNPFIHWFTVDFSTDNEKKLDRRLGIAAVILLLAIEGRQN
jgi:hypothetical protein